MSDFLFVHSSVDDAGLSPIEFRILCHISRRQGQNGQAWPSLETIARVCKIKDIRTVRKALRQLEQKGVITTMPRNGGTPIRWINSVEKWEITPSQKMRGVGKRTWGSPDKQMPAPGKKCRGSKNGRLVPSKNAHPPLAKNESRRESIEGDPIKASPPNPPRGAGRWKNKILVDELYGLFPRREGRRPRAGEKFRDKFNLAKVLQQHDAEGIRSAIISYAATFTASEIEPGSYVANRGRHIDGLSNWCATEGWKVIHRFQKGSMNREATSIVGEAAVRS
jgi:hypothetical protein